MRLSSLLDLNLGVSVFSVGVSLDVTAESSSDLLQTVANTENGDAGSEYIRVDVR
jgi:hypothetical protein